MIRKGDIVYVTEDELRKLGRIDWRWPILAGILGLTLPPLILWLTGAFSAH